MIKSKYSNLRSNLVRGSAESLKIGNDKHDLRIGEINV